MWGKSTLLFKLHSLKMSLNIFQMLIGHKLTLPIFLLIFKGSLYFNNSNSKWGIFCSICGYSLLGGSLRQKFKLFNIKNSA